MNKYTSEDISDLDQEYLKQLYEEISKLKQKLEAIRTIIVDVFDRNTNGDAYLYYYALLKIEKH